MPHLTDHTLSRPRHTTTPATIPRPTTAPAFDRRSTTAPTFTRRLAGVARRLAVLAAVLVAIPLIAAPAAYAADLPSRTRVTAAKLRQDGARVRVELSVTCPAGASIRLTVTVTAANGTRIAQGTRTKNADCTGSAQDEVVRVDADPAGALFIRGLATARTVRTVCDPTGCTTIPFDETIRITR